MGCGSSTEQHRTLQTVDDSVHVMLQKDKKRAAEAKKAAKANAGALDDSGASSGGKGGGYKPRAPHPLLEKPIEAKEEEQ